MAKEYIKLSHKELGRVEVIRSVIRKQRCLPAAGRYQNREYQIQTHNTGYRLRYSTVTLCETFQGNTCLLQAGYGTPPRQTTGLPGT